MTESDEEMDISTLFDDIHKKNRQREKSKLEIYNRILNRAYKKIKYSADHDCLECYFEIPKFMLGCPLYNRNECCNYIIDKLRNAKFTCTVITNEQLLMLGINSDNIIMRIQWEI
tara:strand:+ start:9371 stop:9715 length:345 start_codon:yes stop_codon:yes gene_type:complete